MPISFEAPQPLSPSISAGYGQAQAGLAALPTLASLYEHAAQLAQSGRLHDAALAAQVGQGNAQRVQQAGEAQAGVQERQADREFRQQQLDAQTNLAREHMANQQWLATQPLSFAEQKQLRQMQQSVGIVMADPYMTDEEKSNAVTLLRTGIDPLRQRQERDKAEQLRALAQQENERAQLQAAHTKTFQDFMAQGGPPVRHTFSPAELARVEAEVPLDPALAALDPQAAAARRQQQVEALAASRGLGSKWVQYEPGKWRQETPPKPDRAGREQPATDVYGRTPKEVQAAVHDVQKRVDDWIHQKQSDAAKNGQPVPQFDRDALVEKEIGEQEKYLDRAFPGRRPQPRPQDGGGGGPGQSPQPREQQPPFELHAPRTPEQRQFMQGYQELAARAATLPPDRRAEAEALILRMGNLVREAGSFDQIADPAKKSAYVEARQRLAAILPQNLPASAPPPTASLSAAPAYNRPNNPPWYPGGIGAPVGR